ncbi:MULTISPECIES: response regulator [unclassified Pseudactinotalea]|uniref:response regulator n=1 Tax=unclassified Pseudactinotalea TaxID=2649176 RepID=UPI003C7A77A5
MSSPAEHETPAGDAGVRVVLVDDQPLLREGIATILDAQPGITVVGQASTGAEALEVVADTGPDVVCMDVEMPGMNGLEATRAIIAADPGGPKVLVLTTFSREDYLLEALRAGASAFLLKTARPEQLADAIRSVADGDALLSPEVTRAIIERAVSGADLDGASPGQAGPAAQESSAVGHPATGRADAGADPLAPARGAGGNAARPAAAADLTEREREVLALVARGMSNDEIAAHLVIGRATVKTHVSNLLMKLHLRDRVQAVAFAYRHGLAGQD